MAQLEDVDIPTQPASPPTPRLATIVSRLLSLRSLYRRARERRLALKDADRVNTMSPNETMYFRFTHLPADIILEVMKFLRVEDVISLSMASRTLYTLSHAPTIWKCQARKHLALSRPLVIPSLPTPMSSSASTTKSSKQNTSYTHPTIPTLTHLDPSTLRNAVLATTKLSHAWSRPSPLTRSRTYPRALTPLTTQPTLTKLSIPLSDPRCVISCVTPRHLLVVTRVQSANANANGNGDGVEQQELVGWDMEKDVCVGRWRLKETLMSARAEWTTGSCYYVAGRCVGMSTFEFSLIHVQFLNESTPPPPPPSSSHLTPTPDNTTAQNLVPPSTVTPPSTSEIHESVSKANENIEVDLMSTSTLARYAMPFSAEITVHILDVEVRMVAVLFEWRRDGSRTGRTGSTLGVVVIFDWESGESVGFDTGLAFTYPSTTASVHLTPDRQKLIVYTDSDAPVEETTRGRKVWGVGRRKVVVLGRAGGKGDGRIWGNWEEVVEGVFGSRSGNVRRGRVAGFGAGVSAGVGVGMDEEDVEEYGWDVRVAGDDAEDEDEAEQDRKVAAAGLRRVGRTGKGTRRARRSGVAREGADVTARDVEAGRSGRRASSDTSRSDTLVDGEERRMLDVGGVVLRTRSMSRTNSIMGTMQQRPRRRRRPPVNVPVLDSSTRICMWSRHENWPVFDDANAYVDGVGIGRGQSGLKVPSSLNPAPARSSRISLHAVPVTKDTPGSAGGRMWYIVQNYVSSLPETFGSGSSLHPPRLPLTILPLPSPVLKHLSPNQHHNLLMTQSWPLLGISFNRVCWIEVVKTKRMSMMRRGRRVVRIATFPEPWLGSLTGSGGSRRAFEDEEDDGETYGWPSGTKVVTLDIPSRVLRNACHLLLSEVRGTVTVVSNANEVYTYSFV